MIAQAIGDLLPSAVGVALSPVPIVAIVLILGTPRARIVGPAFAAGWILGLTVAVVVVTALSRGGGDEDGEPSAVVGWVLLALGVLFLALAVEQWRGRPRPGHPVEPPAWMAGLDAVATPRAVLLGAALAGANPKNLALAVAAATTIGQADLSTGGAATAIAVFVVVGSLTVAGPTLFSLVAPSRAAGPLTALKDVMADHNAVIMVVVLVVLGAKLIGNGLGAVAT